MLVGVVFILLAWFVKMPLWLSIVTTIVGAFEIIFSLIRFGVKVQELTD